MPSANARVLIIEDEPLISMDVSLALEEKGFKVCTTDSAERALEVVRKGLAEGRVPDLISVDNNLRGKMLGYEFIEHIRTDTAMKPVWGVPVLAYSSDELPDALAKKGNIVYLPKGRTSTIQVANVAQKLVHER